MGIRKYIDLIKPYFPMGSKDFIKNRVIDWRTISRQKRSLPDFVVIGTQKGGTGSLFYYLVQHPHILRPIQKQMYYFDRNKNKSLAWYRAAFPRVRDKENLAAITGKNIITGEATPEYMYFPDIPEAAFKALPNTKLISILRDPVKRVHSSFYYFEEYHSMHPDFETYIQAEIKAYQAWEDKSSYEALFKGEDKFPILLRGFYALQLEGWLNYFPKEQLLILPSESLFKETDKTFNKVLSYLAVEAHSLESYAVFNPTKTEKKPISAETKKQLEELYRPHNQKLYELCGENFNWS